MIDIIDVYQKLISNSFEKIPKLNLARKGTLNRLNQVSQVSHACEGRVKRAG